MPVDRAYVCALCPVEQHFTWMDFTRHMRRVHGRVARLSLVRGGDDPPAVPFRPRLTGECGVCHAEGPSEKLGACRECGGQFCGAHILDHPCPLSLEVF